MNTGAPYTDSVGVVHLHRDACVCIGAGLPTFELGYVRTLLIHFQQRYYDKVSLFSNIKIECHVILMILLGMKHSGKQLA